MVVMSFIVIFPDISERIAQIVKEPLEINLVLFVRLFDLRLFGFICFLFLFVSGNGCGL